jgi:hippurate hydrolase
VAGGASHNVLPGEATLTGTVRSFDAEVQDRLEAALREAVAGIAVAHGVEAQVSYHRYYPATVSSAAEALLALEAAAAAGLQASVAPRPAFTSEDFAFLLQARPGAYLWLGQGGERPLRHACYDFNDEALPHGVRWFCAVAERVLAPTSAQSIPVRSRRPPIGRDPGTAARWDSGS